MYIVAELDATASTKQQDYTNRERNILPLATLLPDQILFSRSLVQMNAASSKPQHSEFGKLIVVSRLDRE